MEVLKKLKVLLHRHWFRRWEYLNRVPSAHGGSTGFAVSVCGVEGCGCVAIMPRANLVKNAALGFREEFMEALKKNGQRLID